MEKLKRMYLRNAEVLDKKEMKQVTGGNSAAYACTSDADCSVGSQCVDGRCRTNCSTQCPDGTYIEITGCMGTCTAGDGYVECEGATQVLTKSCK